ncbi:2-oxoglutarate-dependent dioxygenase DAO-like [Chenopodium quinoa]|uniref:2-oxoglutarate-dependent dioxygenase DAO n=1 Tax=Chenopodium quinoa TaxID=63459 RepID=A0A803KWB9_CHEQI|nr:2-oxoglutarate-dependent dioxygenase DAO-like [Chenopodium quinoa]
MEGKIPVIDAHQIEEKSVKLREIIEKWGCFRIINHGVPLKLMAEMKSVSKELLDLPIEIKQQNVDVIPGSGYMAPSQNNPVYEALGLFDVSSSLSNFCSQLQVSPHQREIIESYARATHKAAIDIASKMLMSLGLTDYNFEGWPLQFRINKYRFTPEAIGSSGVQIHTDSAFLTFLQDDENLGGLEVMNESGEFVAADPLPGTMVVNLGDVAVLWSNGVLRNVQHRVQCKGAGVRVSIATFLSPPQDKIIEAPAEFVDAQHPRLYAPITYREVRRLRNSKKLHSGEILELIRLGK